MYIVDEIEENQSDDEEEENIPEAELSKNYKIGIPAGEKFGLLLKFTRDISQSEKREILLPIEMKGVGKIPELKRVYASLFFVVCLRCSY